MRAVDDLGLGGGGGDITAPDTGGGGTITTGADGGAGGGGLGGLQTHLAEIEIPPPPPPIPVPPVPPPPIDVNIGGQGGPGVATFARVGSQQAAPFRTPNFAQNRFQTAGENGPNSVMPGGGHGGPRFGPGVPATTGAPPFFDAGGSGQGPGPQTDDDLARIVAAVAGRRR